LTVRARVSRSREGCGHGGNQQSDSIPSPLKAPRSRGAQPRCLAAMSSQPKCCGGELEKDVGEVSKYTGVVLLPLGFHHVFLHETQQRTCHRDHMPSDEEAEDVR